MTTFIIRQVIYYFRKQSLPHVYGTHLPDLFLNLTTKFINSNKNEINDYLYHAPGNLIFYKSLPAAWSRYSLDSLVLKVDLYKLK